MRNDSHIIYFVQCAKDYVLLIEQIMKGQDVSLRQISKAVAALYAAAFDLPDPNLPENDVLPGTFESNFDEWKDLFRGIGKWFYANLAEVKFSPEEEEEMYCMPVEDDLADIYGDIKPGLRAWDASIDAYLPEVVFHWKCFFETHWGQHAVNAMRVLHEMERK